MQISPQAYAILSQENKRLRETINQLKEELKSQGEVWKSVANSAIAKERELHILRTKINKMKQFLDRAKTFLEEKHEEKAVEDSETGGNVTQRTSFV